MVRAAEIPDSATGRRRYLITEHGDVLSQNLADGSFRCLSRKKGSRHPWVKIGGRWQSVQKLFVASFFAKEFERFSPTGYKVYACDGCPEHVSVRNIAVLFYLPAGYRVIREETA